MYLVLVAVAENIRTAAENNLAPLSKNKKIAVRREFLTQPI